MKCDEIFAALAMLEKERGISQTFMMDKIVQALTTAYKRDHEGVENVIVDVDEAKRDLKMYVQKEVVEEVENPGTQMSLEDAKKLSAKYEVGSIVNLPVDNVEFGRIAAGNGKQVIIQGLREAESGMVYEEYNSKQHEILTGVVTRIDPRNGSVALRIGTGAEATDAILTAGEQVKGETLVEGQRIKVYLVDVRRQSRGPQVVISRTHPGLVKRLFELEVPEIYDGTVEIRSIAREAGSRTKMAVWSNDANVDPIGACVGPRGQRVNNIVEELRGEKIDIIKYSDDPAEYIAAALAPADVVEVRMAEDGSKACRVIVPDDQLSLAMGNTLRLPVAALSTTGAAPVITATEAPPSVTGEQNHLGILYYNAADRTVVIVPSSRGAGVINLYDAQTNTTQAIAYTVSGQETGINIYKDNNFFTFINKNGGIYDENAGPDGQTWSFSKHDVPAWGADNTAPSRGDLSYAEGGSRLTFRTVASAIDLYVKGTVQVESTFPGFAAQTVAAEGGTAGYASISFGDNVTGYTHTVTITVPERTAEAVQFDKLVEYYYGNAVPTPADDGNAPQIYSVS